MAKEMTRTTREDEPNARDLLRAARAEEREYYVYQGAGDGATTEADSPDFPGTAGYTEITDVSFKHADDPDTFGDALGESDEDAPVTRLTFAHPDVAPVYYTGRLAVMFMHYAGVDDPVDLEGYMVPVLWQFDSYDLSLDDMMELDPLTPENAEYWELRVATEKMRRHYKDGRELRVKPEYQR